MRYRLRTLLILLALGPPIIAIAWWYGKAALGVLVFLILFVGIEAVLFPLSMLFWCLEWLLTKKREHPRKNQN